MSSCGHYICNKPDIISFDDDVDQPCIAFDNDICTSCENVKGIRNIDITSFDADPIQKVFGIEGSTPERTRAFREELFLQCGLPIPPTRLDVRLDTIQTVPIPNISKFNGDLNIVEHRLKKYFFKSFRKTVHIYLQAFKDVVILATVWNKEIRSRMLTTELDFTEYAKRGILDVINEYNITFGFSHQPRYIPLGTATYVRELTLSTRKSFIKSIIELVGMKGLCFEGKLQYVSGKLRRQTRYTEQS
jgi:hypothetical protein